MKSKKVTNRLSGEHTKKKIDNKKKSNKKKKTKVKKASGMIVEYNHNRQHDKFVLNYILKTPQVGLFVLLPTIKLSDELRSKLYDFVHKYGHIKAIKKIRLDYDNVVKLVNQFYIRQHKDVDIDKIKRKILLDVSWQQNNKKSVYVIVWKKRGSVKYKHFEKKLHEFLMKYELSKVLDDNLTEFISNYNDLSKSSIISGSSSARKYSINTKTMDITTNKSKNELVDKLNIIANNTYPLNTQNSSNEEVTLNFLTNVIVNKLYSLSGENYYDTVIFSKILFSKNIVKNL
jgi:hypothetical protein